MVGVAGQVVEWISTSDGRLAVEIRGPDRNPAVVCLHGLTASRVTWRPLADRSPDSRFLLVDLLGRGLSDAPSGARYDLRSEVRRLATVLNALGIRRPLLAGHSHGAALAVAAARQVDACGLLLVNPVPPDLARPFLLRLLDYAALRAVLGPALRLFRRPLTRYILVRRVFAEPAAVPPGLTDRYAEPWGDAARAAVLPRILADWDPAELGGCEVPGGIPIVVIAGGKDRRINPESARRWAAALGATFHVAEGCGHSIPEERTTELAAELEALLTRILTEERKGRKDDQERSVDSTPGS